MMMAVTQRWHVLYETASRSGVSRSLRETGWSKYWYAGYAGWLDTGRLGYQC